MEPIVERPSVVKANVSAEELMARLADEDEEDGDDVADDVAVPATRRLTRDQRRGAPARRVTALSLRLPARVGAARRSA